MGQASSLSSAIIGAHNRVLNVVWIRTLIRLPATFSPYKGEKGRDGMYNDSIFESLLLTSLECLRSRCERSGLLFRP